MKVKNVLQKDIAEALGVSVNTVSHALRDMSDISEETIRKVKEKAKELGYIPNSMAIKLKFGSSKTIALVYDNLTNPYFTIMASKLFKLIKARGYDTIICPSNNDNKLTAQTFNDLLSLKIDGIFSFLDIHEQVVNTDAFKASNITIVGRTSQYPISAVYTNDYSGGYLVGEYFKKKGYKKILFVGPESINESSRRSSGLVIAYANTNNPIQKYTFTETDDIKPLISFITENRFEGIFAFNDVIGTMIQRELYKKDIDVEVVGFDALHTRLAFVDNLTSVCYDFDKIAEFAVETLFAKIEGDESVRKIEIPVTLYEKDKGEE